MRRSLPVAALVLACAALAPACILNAGPIGGDGGGGDGAGAPTGGTGAGMPTTGGGGTGGAMAVCGDGVLGGEEQCDDGNTVAGTKDGCGADCVIEPGWACGGEPSMCAQTCGDGDLDQGEQCDDGNTATMDGCSQGCQVEKGWECDGAEPSVCHLTCGDGTLDGGEGCDDGGTAAGDGCDDLCKPEAGYMCEQPGGDPAQPSVCMTVCGDGVVAGAEVCDDADTDDTNGCKADCSGANPGWTCDSTGGAGSCATACGDGLPAGAEECDDFNTDAGDGCSAQCKLEHTCNNGIVDPGEACDGGPGCMMCALDPMSVCGKALVIPPGDVDPATGVRTSYYDNKTDAQGVAVLVTDVPSQGCDTTFNLPVLHTYTTGKRPSIVTVESLTATVVGGTDTFDNTLLWVYRDCPGKSDLEACDNDGAQDGKHSKVQTGYVPAQTTLYIVISGEGGGGNDKGVYQLQVTEQPVKLFFHEDFGGETMAGVYPPPADLTATSTGNGAAWKTCVPGALSPCLGINLNSHSGGAFGLGYAPSVDLTAESATLATPKVNLTGLQVARAQYTFVFNDGVGNDSGMALPYDDATADMANSRTYSNMTSSGRAFVPLPLVSKASVAFVYDDGASNAAGKFSVDDIYVYGY